MLRSGGMSVAGVAVAVAVLLLRGPDFARSLDNGLARRPPMGWMSWERYRCVTDCNTYPHSCVNEALYMEMADRLSADGWAAAGYTSVHLDDCWMAPDRAADGQLQGDSERFPSGMKALGDYIHSRGLTYGIYEDFGTKTCAGYPGSEGHLAQDARTFAHWGVDYLKLDGCNSNITEMDTGYPEMSRRLNETGRPIVYSCSWPDYVRASGIKPDYVKVAKYCNLWRNYDDVDDSWASVRGIIKWYTENYDTLAPVHGPGQWNDPDMLVVGDYGLSQDQQQTQMALWAIFAAPLIMSNNLRQVPASARRLLLNPRVIAVNQDPMGQMGRKLPQVSGSDVYVKAILPPGSYALAFHCPGGPYPIKVSYLLKDLGLADSRGYNVTDVFSAHSYGLLKPESRFNATINPYGTFMVTAVTFMVTAVINDSDESSRGTSRDSSAMSHDDSLGMVDAKRRHEEQLLSNDIPPLVPSKASGPTQLRRQLVVEDIDDTNNNSPYVL